MSHVTQRRTGDATLRWKTLRWLMVLVGDDNAESRISTGIHSELGTIPTHFAIHHSSGFAGFNEIITLETSSCH